MHGDETAEVYIVQQSKTGIHISGDGKFIIYESKNGVKAELPEEWKDEE